MTLLVFVLCALVSYRLTILVCRDEALAPPRRLILRRFKPRPRPLFDPNGDPSLINNPATDHLEPAVEIRAHPLYALLTSWPAVGLWVAALVVLVAHGVGLAGSWGAVGFGWVACAGVVELLEGVGE